MSTEAMCFRAKEVTARRIDRVGNWETVFVAVNHVELAQADRALVANQPDAQIGEAEQVLCLEFGDAEKLRRFDAHVTLIAFLMVAELVNEPRLGKALAERGQEFATGLQF